MWKKSLIFTQTFILKQVRIYGGVEGDVAIAPLGLFLNLLLLI